MKPKPITKLDLAFGGNMKELLPPMSEIPDQFKRGTNKWIKFQQDWFFSGLKNLNAKPREGIDPGQALAHLGAIQASFEPKHEHKESAVAYLASLWFEDVSYEVRGVQEIGEGEK